MITFASASESLANTYYRAAVVPISI